MKNWALRSAMILGGFSLGGQLAGASSDNSNPSEFVRCRFSSTPLWDNNATPAVGYLSPRENGEFGSVILELSLQQERAYRAVVYGFTSTAGQGVLVMNIVATSDGLAVATEVIEDLEAEHEAAVSTFANQPVNRIVKLRCAVMPKLNLQSEG